MTTPSSEIIVKKVKSEGGKRFYAVNGSRYPSVTTILDIINKPQLVRWSANLEREHIIRAAADLWEDAPLNGDKMKRIAFIATLKDRIGKVRAHERELKKAGEIGKQLHKLIEWNIRKQLGQAVGKEPTIEDKAMWAFMVWEEWAKKSKFKPILCEQAVWSNEHQYAGTMDLLAEITEGDLVMRVVVDWKTGKAIYPEALLQNVAYVKALIEMGHGEPPIHGLVVRLPKDEKDPEPEVRLIPWAEQDELFGAFLHARALWGWQYGNGK